MCVKGPCQATKEERVFRSDYCLLTVPIAQELSVEAMARHLQESITEIQIGVAEGISRDQSQVSA